MFMLSKRFAPAPDEVRFELETECLTFLVGAPAVKLLWKVSLVSNCILEGAVDNLRWSPPKVELFVAICHSEANMSSFSKLCQISNEVTMHSNFVFQSEHADSSFQLSASVRFIGSSSEISEKNWRLVAKTVENDVVVWMSHEIQISFGAIALKVLPSSNEICYIGARCTFDFHAMNPFGIPVPGVVVTVVNSDQSAKNSFSLSRLQNAVSNNHGFLSVSIEYQREIIGGIAIIGFMLHGAGGTRYLTTKNITVVNIVQSILNPEPLDFSKDMVFTAFAPGFHFRSNKTGETKHQELIPCTLFIITLLIDLQNSPSLVLEQGHSRLQRSREETINNSGDPCSKLWMQSETL
jgi:hypothetical protein